MLDAPGNGPCDGLQLLVVLNFTEQDSQSITSDFFP